MNVTRPTPVGTTGKGKPAYSGPAVGAYRAYFGISQQDVASRMGVGRTAVINAEHRDLLGARVAERMLNEVDYIWRLRSETRRNGIVAMQAMRDPDDEATLTVERVLDHVTDEPRSLADLASASGVEPDDVIQVMADLFLAGHVERVPEGWVRAEAAAIMLAPKADR